ncbi:MAG: type II secretion system protein GspE, partial [Pseudomonadota bacterium]
MALPGDTLTESLPEAEPQATPKQLPFSFAKRFGVLVEPLESDEHRCRLVYRKGAALNALAEAHRVAGPDAEVVAVDEAAFDAALQAAYERGSGQAMQMIDGFEEGTDLFQVAQELPEQSDLLESDDEAPIIRLINALLTEA